MPLLPEQRGLPKGKYPADWLWPPRSPAGGPGHGADISAYAPRGSLTAKGDPIRERVADVIRGRWTCCRSTDFGGSECQLSESGHSRFPRQCLQCGLWCTESQLKNEACIHHSREPFEGKRGGHHAPLPCSVVATSHCTVLRRDLALLWGSGISPIQIRVPLHAGTTGH